MLRWSDYGAPFNSRIREYANSSDMVLMLTLLFMVQTTPVLAGLAIGASAYAAKFALEAAVKFRSASGPSLRPFYKVRG